MFSFINNPLILQYTIIMNMVYAYDDGDEHIGCAYHFFIFAHNWYHLVKYYINNQH